jgi:hypothetical protein
MAWGEPRFIRLTWGVILSFFKQVTRSFNKYLRTCIFFPPLIREENRADCSEDSVVEVGDVLVIQKRNSTLLFHEQHLAKILGASIPRSFLESVLVYPDNNAILVGEEICSHVTECRKALLSDGRGTGKRKFEVIEQKATSPF